MEDESTDSVECPWCMEPGANCSLCNGTRLISLAKLQQIEEIEE
jgi:hypothetical protein